MAKRNKRQMKKMRLGEFKEIGFILKCNFAAETSEEQLDKIFYSFDDFLASLNLEFIGKIDHEVFTVIKHVGIGKCSEDNRSTIITWFKDNGATDLKASNLFDLNWDEPNFDE